MSRIGKAPIALPEKVEVAITPVEISVKGPLGTLTQTITHGVTIEKVENRIQVKAAGNSREAKASTVFVRWDPGSSRATRSPIPMRWRSSRRSTEM